MKKKDRHIDYLKLAGYMCILILISVVSMAAVKHRIYSPLSKVNIQIDQNENGDPFINKKLVIGMIKNYFGDHLANREVVDTDIQLIEEVLEENPYIEDANAFIDGNNRLKIEIKQRNPILRIMNPKGESYYLDDDAKALPLHDKAVRRVLVITIDKNSLTEKEKKNALDLVKLIEKDTFLKALVEQIHIKSNSEYVIVPKVGNEIIELGTIERIESKLKKLKGFYKNGIPITGWNKYKIFDLRFKDQLVCKKR